MYYLIFDSFASKPKYQKTVAQIEGRFVDLGLKMNVIKLNLLRSLKETIEEGVKKGVQTVVAVGDDSLFTKLINLAADKKIVVGFIPLRPSRITSLLGIPEGEAACSIISARRTAVLDLGKINNLYFVANV